MPRILDLFCGAGGAAMGYHRAGFEVVGVDNRPQPHYPFEFIQADALKTLADVFQRYNEPGWKLFDAIHASPPCQAHSALSSLENGYRSRLFSVHPDMIAPTRDLLEQTGLPYIIENVPGAPVRPDVVLCGSQFAVGAVCRDGTYRALRRHRHFELGGWTLRHPPPRCHHRGPTVGVYGHGGGNPQRMVSRGRGYMATLIEGSVAMGIDWMSMPELGQAIPPAYTELLGHQLLASLPA